MPTIFFKFGLRFYFVSYDCREPAHIHVGDDVKKICKYWLQPNKIILANNYAFNKRELARIEKVISENYSDILIAFNEFCKGYKK
ncbi:MAG: DUF4160 domain-containing protein [Bacteroidota bacterium]|nr:DUF4160 domain-containing protein [Bacteroidota bacterium]